MKRLQALATSQNRTDLPPFEPGDTVKVHVRVIEGEKERVQVFEGVVIGIRGGGNSKTFIVRKISGGIGVERIFPYNSPMIRTIEVTREGHVRRAKLFYLRDRVGKRARVRQRRPGTGRRPVVPGEGESPQVTESPEDTAAEKE